MFIVNCQKLIICCSVEWKFASNISLLLGVEWKNVPKVTCHNDLKAVVIHAFFVISFQKTVPSGSVRFHHGGHGRGGFAAVHLSLCQAVVSLYETDPLTKGEQ